MADSKVSIQELTSKAEAGDSDFVRKALDGTGSFEERTKILKEMDTQNQKNREEEEAKSGKSTLPDLEIKVGAYSETEVRSSIVLRTGAAGNRTKIYDNVLDLRNSTSKNAETIINVEELTKRAEAGDGTFVRAALDKVATFEERAKVLQQMDKLNQKHREDDSRKGRFTVPDLEVEIGTYSENQIRSNITLKSGVAGNRGNLYNELFDIRDQSRNVEARQIKR